MNLKQHTDKILRCKINKFYHPQNHMLFTQKNIHEKKNQQNASVVFFFFFKATERVGIAFRIRLPEGRTAG